MDDDPIADYHLTLSMGFSGKAAAFERAAELNPETADELLKLAAIDREKGLYHRQQRFERLDMQRTWAFGSGLPQ